MQFTPRTDVMFPASIESTKYHVSLLIFKTLMLEKVSLLFVF